MKDTPMSNKHPASMNEKEFNEAFRNKAWRNTNALAAKPAAVKLHASEMTEAEFEAALRSKTWRTSAVEQVEAMRNASVRS
jgi:hypothetical protein